jgi:hypothetical protein
MSIYFSCFAAGGARELLNISETGSGLQKVRGETVPRYIYQTSGTAPIFTSPPPPARSPPAYRQASMRKRKLVDRIKKPNSFSEIGAQFTLPPYAHPANG